ncbi:MAG: 6,7-dimethyl-8-ribityllumazine synthase [Dehalococcoidia bacterium]|nr:6,7-dimethyl-8-ribityllumazine synthase [Dehalococcoidia bacterium]
MTQEHEGSLRGEGLRVAIVCARFNDHIVGKLLSGAKEALKETHVKERDTLVAWVPGSFELPLTAQEIARSGHYDAIVCLGAIIRGETAHFEHISRVATDGINAVSREFHLPVMLGVLTTNDLQQALERSGGKVGNTGYNVTIAAIQMVNLLRQLELTDKSAAKH